MLDCSSVPPCSFQYGRPTFGPSCTEFVYPERWHFDNDATSKIDDVLTEHGGLLHVLPLAVHLVGDTILNLSCSEFFCFMLKSYQVRWGGGMVMAHKI